MAEDPLHDLELGTPTSLPPSGERKLPKPVGQWVVKVQYDPDQGCRPEDFQTAAPDYAKRFGVLGSSPLSSEREKFAVSVPGQRPFVPVELEGTILEPITTSEVRRWKPVRINSVKEFKEFTEGNAGRRKRAIESVGDSGFFGSDDPIPAQNAFNLIDKEFIPILSGPFFKQLYIYDYLLMHARAFELTNHNALAAAAIKIFARFAIGRGVSFHIKHPEAKRVWDEFREANNLRNLIRMMARDLTWQGELMLRYHDDRESGKVKLRVVDPSTCWEVVTDPEDIEHVYYYHFQWPTPYQIWTSGTIPVSKYVIQQTPPTNVQHVKINCSSMEKRGRSDLLAAMAWLKRFNDFYNGTVIKAILEANLVWKIKVKGDQADVDAFLSSATMAELPPPGGQWVENDAVELLPVSAQLTAGRGSSGIGQQLANIVAASMNLPGEYFNVEGTGPARATALIRTDPAVKAIEDRQQLLQETLEDVYDRVMAIALMAKRVSPTAAREEPEVVADEELEGEPEDTLDEDETGANLVRLT